MRLVLYAIAALLFACGSPLRVEAESLLEIHIYDDATLRSAKARFEPNVRASFAEDLIATLPRTQRLALTGIALDMPLRGFHPLDFHSNAQRRLVVAPIESFLFLDELVMTYSWFNTQNCDARPILSYVFHLFARRTPQAQVGPLSAFRLSGDVLMKDPIVAAAAQKSLKTAGYFLLAHEVGHVVHRHTGGLIGDRSQQQEIEADDFALDAMARIGVIPAGIPFYFLAAQTLEPFDADQVQQRSHPLSAARLNRVADRLDRLAANPLSFVDSEPNPARAVELTQTIANDVRDIAGMLDPSFRRASKQFLTEAYPVESFARACPLWSRSE